MDSITHIVLGATVGEALAGRKLGKRAMLLGAIANSLPDIDAIGSFWLGTAKDVLAHRGITHSFLFVAVMTFVLAAIAERVYSRRGAGGGGAAGVGGGASGAGDRGAAGGVGGGAGSGMSRKDWWIFFGVELLLHIFIDAFNAYGTGWFEPFSHYRVSFHVLFVADPFYTVWLLLSFFALLLLRKGSRARKGWVWVGLVGSSLYLGYCISNKLQIDSRVKKDMAAQGIGHTRYFSTPTPLNNWLWYVVAEDSGGFHTGYRSMFDHQPTHFRWLPRNVKLLEPFRGHEDLEYLLRFSQGYFTVEQWGDTLVYNDLRFGEIRGWADPKARFVFHYFLQYPDQNGVVVQRGRMDGWNRRTLRVFVRRIRGN